MAQTTMKAQQRLTRDAPQPFKGFGPAPSKQRSKKESTSKSQSTQKPTSRFAPRGGTANYFRRTETAQDAQIKIHARASNLDDTLLRSNTEDQNESSSSEEESSFGPRGLLLSGFNQADFLSIKDWFYAMEPDFRVSCCSDDLLSMPSIEALSGPDGSFRDNSEWEKTNEIWVPRVALFSGTSSEEYLGIIQYWESTGIKQPMFACATKNTSKTPLRALLLEITRANSRNENEESGLDRDRLRNILRERLDAKARGEPANGPVVL